MLRIQFKSVELARRYQANASSARVSFANTVALHKRERIGRHTYIILWHRFTGAQTRVYAAHVERMWNGR